GARPRPRRRRHRRREGNLGDGRAVTALLAALVAAVHLNVFAAASLTEVLPRLDHAERYQFAGSDQLAFQIRQGAPADLFLAASPKYPQDLYADGLCSKPVVFATNTVVLVVPRANPARIHSVYDL